jgi:mannose/fructose-specific phosphotransferase system component IIA
VSFVVAASQARSCTIVQKVAIFRKRSQLEVARTVRPFRIVVVSHGELAAALCATAELICGPLDGVTALGLDASAAPEELARQLRAVLEPNVGPNALSNGASNELPTLVLADLAGGTPFNVASLVARQVPNVEVLGGTNLGLLVEAITSLDPIEQVVPHLIEAGRAGIREAAPLRLRRVS